MPFNIAQGPRQRIGIGVVLSQVILRIKSSLPAKVAELNAWYHDDVVLVPPADNCIINSLAWPKYLDGYPAVMVRPFKVALGGLPAGEAIGITEEYKRTHQWVLVVMDAADSFPELTTRLERWSLAFFELLGGEDSLDCGHTRWQAEDWNQPIVTRDSGNLAQDLPMLFNTYTFEFPDASAYAPISGAGALEIEGSTT